MRQTLIGLGANGIGIQVWSSILSVLLLIYESNMNANRRKVSLSEDKNDITPKF